MEDLLDRAAIADAIVRLLAEASVRPEENEKGPGPLYAGDYQPRFS